MSNVTRDELAKRISGFGLGEREARTAVDAVFGEIGKAIARGERVELRGFGIFSAARMPRRTNARNPKTGESVVIPERRLPRFKAGKELRRIVAVA